jgi:hypothetical protein
VDQSELLQVQVQIKLARPIQVVGIQRCRLVVVRAQQVLHQFSWLLKKN